VPAEQEDVVVSPHLLQAEEAGHDLGQPLLQRRAGRDERLVLRGVRQIGVRRSAFGVRL
jgi:hypothetical protein